MEHWERQYEVLANILTDRGVDVGAVKAAIKALTIEMPSWAVGNSGTRYGVFRQPGAARNIWEKVDDCAMLQSVLGVCPVMASHVNWDKTDDGRYEPVRDTRGPEGPAHRHRAPQHLRRAEVQVRQRMQPV